jgi:hypothetical protein
MRLVRESGVLAKIQEPLIGEKIRAVSFRRMEVDMSLKTLVKPASVYRISNQTWRGKRWRRT